MLLASAALSASATAQRPDYLIWNGATLPLSCNPLEPYLETLGRRPEGDGSTTACWRGYIAYFVLRNDSLFLHDITVMKQDSLNRLRYRSIDKSEFFPGRDAAGDVFADWFTGELYVQYGGMLEYVHMGYESYYRNERVINVKDGRVQSMEEYDNSATYLPFGDGGNDVLRDYLNRAVDYGRLKEVPDSARVYVSVKEVDSVGHILEVKVQNNVAQDLQDEAERVVKGIPRWNVYYRRGQQEQTQWNIPVFFSKWLQQHQHSPRTPYDPSGRHFISAKEGFFKDSANGRKAKMVAWDYYLSFIDAQKCGECRSPYEDLYL